MLLRFGPQPERFRIGFLRRNELADAKRHAHHEAVAFAAGFQQGHAIAGVSRQSIRQNTAC
jgi:hypothetical protein